MKISTEKFLQSSGSKNMDLLAAVKMNAAKLSQTKMMLMQNFINEVLMKVIKELSWRDFHTQKNYINHKKVF